MYEGSISFAQIGRFEVLPTGQLFFSIAGKDETLADDKCKDFEGLFSNSLISGIYAFLSKLDLSALDLPETPLLFLYNSESPPIECSLIKFNLSFSLYESVEPCSLSTTILSGITFNLSYNSTQPKVIFSAIAKSSVILNN
ncbi:hypothetical protein WICMUC_002361 [Wickerhamomyces mucosus]|uniref:Uncharacterized protein n=1 Tax=Wickerhamomyces mucosus TaxID=1378264 RepID=A0A9P8PRM5_9ASCO|nr:hypothetical protein WICMUC_002361 [Wickerhamomyces mucosus]